MLLRRFLKNCDAGVGPLMALAALPLFGFVGAAIDYSRAASMRTSLQAALDATGLMLAKTASTSTAAQVQSSATAFFNANFTRTDAISPTVTAAYTQAASGSTVIITGSTSVKSDFVGLFGFSNINISTSSTTKWGQSRLRVALVLDNTGSMAQSSKLTSLKTAAHNLLTQLQTAAVNPGDVYVSIVPFGTDVNVGASNYQASWIDWSDWEAANGTCSKSSYTSQSTCTANGKKWTPANHNTWNGCVTDRTQNNDVLNTVPTAGTTLFPADQDGSCPTQMVPLSNSWTTLNSKIDAMVAAGNTNQAIGLAHGWQSLTGGGPYGSPPALDPNYQYQQVIILLSDGLNTADRWYNSASPIDARQQLACTNAKNAGMTVYTVLVMSGDSTVLQNCASDSNKYFALTNANQIVTTFNQIGTSLSKLHLAN